jgi:hypothetical protein
MALAGRGMTGAPLIGSGINRKNEAVLVAPAGLLVPISHFLQRGDAC